MPPASVPKSDTLSVHRLYSLRPFHLPFFLLLVCTSCNIHIYISTYINIQENLGPYIYAFPHPLPR
jgi:hypothetical protein